MSDERAVWSNSDGSVSILVPAPGILKERWVLDIPAEAINVCFCTVADLPKDRVFRDAWRQSAIGAVYIDLDAAKNFCHKLRRSARDAQFAPLDRMVTVPGQQEEAEKQRQALRDKYEILQNRIDSANDVVDLKAVLDEIRS